MYITVKNKINALHHFFYEGIFGNDIYNETFSPQKKRKKVNLKISQNSLKLF